MLKEKHYFDYTKTPCSRIGCAKATTHPFYRRIQALFLAYCSHECRALHRRCGVCGQNTAALARPVERSVKGMQNAIEEFCSMECVKCRDDFTPYERQYAQFLFQAQKEIADGRARILAEEQARRIIEQARKRTEEDNEQRLREQVMGLSYTPLRGMGPGNTQGWQLPDAMSQQDSLSCLKCSQISTECQCWEDKL